MSEEKIGMYTAEEIYEELANGFLHHSMVDAMYFKIKDLQQKVEQLEKENKKLNNIIDELENTIANFIENHTESYIDWKYDREIYLAECNILQKLCDTYFDKLKELKENNKDV